MKCLIILDLYKLSGNDIGKLKELQISSKHTSKFLPEYCLNSDNKIRYTDIWLQFTEDGKEEYLLFDIINIEEPLQEEINQCGIEYLLKDTWDILYKLPTLKFDELHRRLALSQHIVIDLRYIGSGEDTEVEASIYGYLNEEKELIKI
jgi:hypothetical protein